MTLEKRISEWLTDTSKLLNISNLFLKKWPKLLKGKEHLIVKLNCSTNQLKSLPNLPNITVLYCNNNELQSLPNFPNLTKLTCRYNQLTSLPKFTNLTQLYCHNNQLKSLPNFANLTFLDCDDNKLELLPNFIKLTKLTCRGNQLKSLPNLPNLSELGCWDNQLKSLPNFKKLKYLYCHDNQLFSNSLKKWRGMWKLQKLRRLDLRKRGLLKVIKIMKLRLYLPRLTNLHRDLIYSPHHPGKFYKKLRLGDWSGENSKPQKISGNL